jgi:ferredoxin-NADP reductase
MEIDGPMGSFSLHKNKDRPAVFLIGGVGITPVYSIIRDASEHTLPHKLYLFYSNRTEKDAPFLKELDSLSHSNKNFTFIPTFTDLPDGTYWKGDKGYINKEMINRRASNIVGAIYYVSGPQAMVLATRKLLDEMGVSEDDIKIEEFSGY